MIRFKNSYTVQTWVAICDTCQKKQEVQVRGENDADNLRLMLSTRFGYTIGENNTIECDDHGEAWQQIEIEY